MRATNAADVRGTAIPRSVWSALQGWIRGVEVDLLGWSLPPCALEIASHHWQPESIDAACTRCGCTRGRGDSREDGCANCRAGRQTAIADGIVRLGPYRSPLSDWVLMIKNARWAMMGEMLGVALAKKVRDSHLVAPGRLVVVPVPTAWTRIVQRGIDHTKCVGMAMAGALGCPCIPLLQHRPGPPQAGRSGSARLRHGGRGLRLVGSGGTGARPPWWHPGSARTARSRWPAGPLTGAHLVLVDDVRTTGATLQRATRLLRRLKPDRVVAAVLCATEADRRNSLP